MSGGDDILTVDRALFCVVAVTGGRKFHQWHAVDMAMRAIEKEAKAHGRALFVVHGDAGGLDNLVKRWCVINAVSQKPYRARWGDLSHPDAIIRRRYDGTPYDAREGHRRNRRMLDGAAPEKLIAFPGGTGTGNCVEEARKRGMPIEFVKEEEEACQ